MTTNDGPGVPPERAPETTSVFRADFLSEAEPPAPEQSVLGRRRAAGGFGAAGGQARAQRGLAVPAGPRDAPAPAGTPTATSSSTTSPSPAGTPSSAATRASSSWCDVGSLNGTYVNREPVDTAV